MIGRRFGNYEVLHLLGTGGIGEIFVGLDRMLNRTVAVKALRREVSHDKASVDRFRIEAENLARLNHPNITTLYSLHQEGDELFMIMELIRGVTLEELLTTAQRLREDEALALVMQALEGVGYAHQANVIHRDIKPANLMVTDNGLVKIMDFGIARVRDSERMTRHGHMVGTATYMAPEQVRGFEGDERTDIYSLSAVLYELLTGHPPFESNNEYELLRAHIESPVTPLKEYAPDVSDRVAAAVSCALAKEPSQRFQSVQDFSRGLDTASLKVRGVDIVRERFFGLVQRRMPSIPDTTFLKQKSVALAKTRLAAMPILPQQKPTRLSNDTASQKPADHKPGLRHSALGVWPITAISMAAVLLVVLIGFVLWDLTAPSLPRTVGGDSGPSTIKSDAQQPTAKYLSSRDDETSGIDHQQRRQETVAKEREETISPVVEPQPYTYPSTIIDNESRAPAAQASSTTRPSQRFVSDTSKPTASRGRGRSQSHGKTATGTNRSRTRETTESVSSGWTWQH
jgi:serine/threonine protein kinase